MNHLNFNCANCGGFRHKLSTQLKIKISLKQKRRSRYGKPSHRDRRKKKLKKYKKKSKKYKKKMKKYKKKSKKAKKKL